MRFVQTSSSAETSCLARRSAFIDLFLDAGFAISDASFCKIHCANISRPAAT